MSESDGERAARSVALEQAYVHDVYEQCAEKTAQQNKHWPRVYKFLEQLEPGALVCDIGCGNGKYLSVNDNVFKVGVDRCKRLSDIAREKENEVLICDNLALPFRDESFDAVLSIAVVHHFATTERRVNALKELARVLRIGGRLVISVWAMEQRHRKFESQDVLVPWPKAYCLDSRTMCKAGEEARNAGGAIKSFDPAAIAGEDDDDDDDYDDVSSINDLKLDSNRIAQKCLVKSARKRGAGAGDGRKYKNKSYWIDPIFSPSPSTSSLSSPNETCYSFFRRALQKLAGGKRGSGNRAWFLETWQNGGYNKNRRRQRRRNVEYDDIGDIDDIPIELRRLEDDNVTFTSKHRLSPDPAALVAGIKSKSLGDILEIQRIDIVRSRSSIPGFSSTLTSQMDLNEESKTPSPSAATTIARDLDPLSMITETTLVESISSNIDSVLNGDDDDDNDPVPIGLYGRARSNGDSIVPVHPAFFPSNNKPRLVKQKTHFIDDSSPLEQSIIDQESVHTTAILLQPLVEQDLDEFQEAHKLAGSKRRREMVHKQSSMNEELMSMERLMEREHVRKNIMKQASLNEEIICKPSRTFGHFRDTLYSGNATKRFQLIKSDLTNRIKQSTTSMENKVSSMAIKNGFVKILQGWKSSESQGRESDDDEHHQQHEELEIKNRDEAKDEDTSLNKQMRTNKNTIGSGGSSSSQTATGGKTGESELIERRLSKEDGSDSSKDSSLQSDTSVDSEDSFASVIYVPKQRDQREHQQNHKHNYYPFSYHPHHQQQQHQGNIAYDNQNYQFPSLMDVGAMTTTTIVPGGYHHQLRTTSAPPSPRIKHPPEIHGPRLKLLSMSPLLKQFPATSKSLPPPSPPGLSPKPCFFTAPDFFPNIITESPDTSNINRENNDNIDDNDDECTSSVETVVEQASDGSTINNDVNDVKNPSEEKINITNDNNDHDDDDDDNDDDADNNPQAEIRSSSSESISETTCTESRRSRLNQIKELLRQKPGFATRCGKSSFPLVRRASTATVSGRSDTIDARSLPRLVSLELFNPETDDLDSDSSGLSSPESVGSVISVISDERFTLKNKNLDTTTKSSNDVETVTQPREDDKVTPGTAAVSSSVIAEEKIILIESPLNLTDKLGVNLMNDIEEYCREPLLTRIIPPATTMTTTTTTTTTTINSTSDNYKWENGKTRRTKANNSYAVQSIPPYVPPVMETIDLSSRISSLRSNCKYSQLVDNTIAWLSGATGPDNGDHYYTQQQLQYDDNIDNNEKNNDESLTKSISEEAMDFVMVTKNGECLTASSSASAAADEALSQRTTSVSIADDDGNIRRPTLVAVNNDNNKSFERLSNFPRYVGESIKSRRKTQSSISPLFSSDEAIGMTESATTINMSKLCTISDDDDGTSCLLGTSNFEYKSLRERRRHLYQKRSASEEIPRRGKRDTCPNNKHQQNNGRVNKLIETRSICGEHTETEDYANMNLKNTNISGSSSQESLSSDRDGGAKGSHNSGDGGAITYHQYYHVFREGELDQLINKYVENLHIISSYYDHASWCIVAEKVQVWTI